MMICRNSENQIKPELLRISVGLQGPNYVSEVQNFVKTLQNCYSIVREKIFEEDTVEDDLYEQYSAMSNLQLSLSARIETI